MVRIPQRHRAILCSRRYKNYAKSVKLERVGIIKSPSIHPGKFQLLLNFRDFLLLGGYKLATFRVLVAEKM